MECRRQLDQRRVDMAAGLYLLRDRVLDRWRRGHGYGAAGCAVHIG